MVNYVLRRIVFAVVVAAMALIVMFCLLRLSGDPTIMMVDTTATQEQVEAVRHANGFDRPIPVQLVIYLGKAVRGDFGDSFRYGQPAFKLVAERLPATLQLATISLLLALLISVPAGIISATRRNTIEDQLVMVGAMFGQTMPAFWLGIMLIMIFAVGLRWFPTGGRGGIQYIVLPAVTLAAYSAARIARLVRTALLDVMGMDYVRVARGKGLAERVVITRHALKNAAIPVVTMVGLQLGYLLAGSVITETVFSWPGLGRLMVQSIQNRDYPVIQASVFMMALVVAAINIIVDIIYAYVDPRIRYS